MSLSQWTKQFTRVGRDGYHLARAIIQDTTATRAVSFKPVLLEHARQSNAVANSLLQVDKHVGLVRYYGVMGYVKQQWQPALKGEDADTSTLSFSTSATATTTTATARVAFMITASMKEELAEKLGYAIDQVKQMTPLQASLVLHHQITPDVLEEQLPIVEQQYEEQKEEEQRQRELEIKAKEKLHQEMELKKKQEQLKRQEKQQQQQQEQVEQQQQQQVAIEGGTSFSKQLPKRSFSGENAFGYHSSNLLLSPESDPDNEFANFWFEIIETNNETDEISRVGLYHDEKEALIGLETRQDIAYRKGRPLEFEMRPVDKKTLFS